MIRRFIALFRKPEPEPISDFLDHPRMMEKRGASFQERYDELTRLKIERQMLIKEAERARQLRRSALAAMIEAELRRVTTQVMRLETMQ